MLFGGRRRGGGDCIMPIICFLNMRLGAFWIWVYGDRYRASIIGVCVCVFVSLV